MTASKKTQYGLTTMSDRCRVCGARLTRRSGPGRPRIVCSIACAEENNRRRSADWRSNGPKVRRCEVCASELPHSRGCSRFCSTSCRRTARTALRRARQLTAVESTGTGSPFNRSSHKGVGVYQLPIVVQSHQGTTVKPQVRLAGWSRARRLMAPQNFGNALLRLGEVADYLASRWSRNGLKLASLAEQSVTS
jgi:hypothetical protein